MFASNTLKLFFFCKRRDIARDYKSSFYCSFVYPLSQRTHKQHGLTNPAIFIIIIIIIIIIIQVIEIYLFAVLSSQVILAYIVLYIEIHLSLHTLTYRKGMGIL
jgi:hypothetical protein